MSASARQTQETVVSAYLWVSGLFALAASLIWAINTVFLIRDGGLTLFQVMLVNAAFTAAQLVCEVPTGVVADTIGRRASMLLAMSTLLISTLLYVLSPIAGWGFTGFFLASLILGLGYTFQTGAVEAWLVDALDATGFTAPKERIFARGQIAFGAGMLSGSLLGGVIGQLNLSFPFVIRAALLAVVFGVVFAKVHDVGFEPRALSLSSFGEESRTVYQAGVRFGWHNRVIRPLFAVSAVTGVFFFYAFYAWQPYVLELLGRDYVWVLGIAQAGFSATGIVGNSLVGRIMRSDELRRDPARVCAATTGAQFLAAAGIAGVGFAFAEPGIVPAMIAIVLWFTYGLLFGMQGPVRAAYLNEHIPSAQRATVISLDALFADGGAAVGQPALGWLSDRASIPVAWLLGSLGLALSAPLYLRSSRAAAEASQEA